MKRISDWGLSAESWKGQRGEYWVLLQGVLMIGFMFLPVYQPAWLRISPPKLYGVWAVAGILFLIAAWLIGQGLSDLGPNLTPLPYPKEDGELVQTGAYGLVRHPLYSGIILAAKAYAIGQLSLSHLLGMLGLLLVLNLKANREEQWLSEKYADYSAYRQRVKKLIPWVF